jgi:hypothetical protein
MIPRRYVFPGVLEMNYQARRRLGVNIYLKPSTRDLEVRRRRPSQERSCDRGRR